MTPTNKGNYLQCTNCSYRLAEGQYPCAFSHSIIRRASGEKLERNFQVCGVKEINELV